MAAPMRYFFHVYDDDVGLDDEGSDLPGPDAAHQAAVEIARELAAWAVKDGELNLAHRIHVTDEQDALINVVTFRDVVRVAGLRGH